MSKDLKPVLEEFTFPDGGEYLGEIRNSQPDGQGECIYPDGSKYSGNWKNGLRHGYLILREDYNRNRKLPFLRFFHH